MQVMAAAGESGEMKGWKEPSHGRRGTTCERLKGIRKREEKKAKKATARNMHDFDVMVRKRYENEGNLPSDVLEQEIQRVLVLRRDERAS
jgi:hypothetical protein